MLRKILLALTILYMFYVATHLDAQDIFWVVETELADNVGTVNTFADPYGIQQAFAAVTTTDEIRIVKGANDYDSTTNSWTNRTDATKDINSIPTFTGGAYALVSCWTDETTQNNGVGACLFNFNTGTGFGFHVIDSGYFFRNIGTTNTTTAGITLVGNDNFCYRCSADNGTFGIRLENARNHCVDCLAHTNSTSGFFSANQGLCYRCEAYGNTDGVILDVAAAIAGVLTYGNTSDGIVLPDGGNFAAQVTTYDNGVDGVSGTGDWMVLLDALSTDNTVYNLRAFSGSSFWIVENFFTFNGGTGEILQTGPIINEVDITAPTGAAVTYQNVGAFDFLPTSGNVTLTIPWPRTTTTSVMFGGTIQLSNVGGSGGVSAVAK